MLHDLECPKAGKKTKKAGHMALLRFTFSNCNKALNIFWTQNIFTDSDSLRVGLSEYIF